MPMPAGIIPVGDGLDPHDRSLRLFYIRDTLLVKAQSDVGWKYQDLGLLENAISGKWAMACFVGLKRAGLETAYCFSCKPENPPQKGVFLVYFYDGPPGFAGPTIIDWDWREEDENHTCRPQGWQRDLGEPIWQQI